MDAGPGGHQAFWHLVRPVCLGRSLRSAGPWGRTLAYSPFWAKGRGMSVLMCLTVGSSGRVWFSGGPVWVPLVFGRIGHRYLSRAGKTCRSLLSHQIAEPRWPSAQAQANNWRTCSLFVRQCGSSRPPSAGRAVCDIDSCSSAWTAVGG